MVEAEPLFGAAERPLTEGLAEVLELTEAEPLLVAAEAGASLIAGPLVEPLLAAGWLAGAAAELPEAAGRPLTEELAEGSV